VRVDRLGDGMIEIAKPVPLLQASQRAVERDLTAWNRKVVVV
jgi:hypothetical protein